MKQKRHKKLDQMWAEFQQQHELTEEQTCLLRQTGYPLAKLEQKLFDAAVEPNPSLSDGIQELHRQWKENLAARQAAIAAGLVEPKKKKKKRKFESDPAWAKSKNFCRLNMEDIRMAEELGLGPRTLMNNVPSATQPWKASVKIWIRELYAKRPAKAASKPVRQG